MSSPSSLPTPEQTQENTTRPATPSATLPANPLRTSDSLTKHSPKTLECTFNPPNIAPSERSPLPAAFRGEPSMNTIFRPRETRKRELDSSANGEATHPPFKVKVVERMKEYNQFVPCHNIRCRDMRTENSRLEQRNVDLRDMLDKQDEEIVRCKLKLHRAENLLAEQDEEMSRLVAENEILLERVAFLEKALSDNLADRRESHSPWSGFVGDRWDGRFTFGKKMSIGDHILIPRHPLDASGSAKVLAAVDVSDVFTDPRQVIVKVFEKDKEVEFRNECGVMTNLGESGIVPRLVAAYETNTNYVSIVNKYEASLVDIPTTLRGNVNFARQTIKSLLEKVDKLHSTGHVNFKITPGSVVFSESGELAFGDSTLCRPLREAKKGGIEGSDGFSAPEVLSGKALSRPRAADMWSVGSVLASLLGKPLNSPINDYRSASAAADRVFARLRDPDGRDFLEKLLCPFPSRRVTAKKALEHRWFTGNPLEAMDCDWIYKAAINRSLRDDSSSLQFPPGPVIPLEF